MKKTVCYFCIILLCCMICIGCQTSLQSDEQLSSAEASGAEPPYLLDFDQARYRELLDSVSKSDEELHAFLREYWYDSNGLETRADILEFQQDYEALPAALRDHPDLTGFYCYPEWKKLTLFFETADQTTYNISISPMKETIKKEMDQEKRSAAKRTAENGDTFYEYTERGEEIRRYFAELNGMYYHINTWNTDDDRNAKLLDQIAICAEK